MRTSARPVTLYMILASTISPVADECTSVHSRRTLCSARELASWLVRTAQCGPAHRAARCVRARPMAALAPDVGHRALQPSRASGATFHTLFIS